MEDLDPDRIAVRVDVGLLGRDAHRAHLGMLQHRARDVVAQGFLQVHVALRHALGHGVAHEVVVDHFIELVGLRGALRQRHEQVDIDQHPLFALLLEFVHADIDLHFVVAQEHASAVLQAGVGKGGEHGHERAAEGKKEAAPGGRGTSGTTVFGCWLPAYSVRNITSRASGIRCWPPSTYSVVPVTARACAR